MIDDWKLRFDYVIRCTHIRTFSRRKLSAYWQLQINLIYPPKKKHIQKVKRYNFSESAFTFDTFENPTAQRNRCQPWVDTSIYIFIHVLFCYNDWQLESKRFNRFGINQPFDLACSIVWSREQYYILHRFADVSHPHWIYTHQRMALATPANGMWKISINCYAELDGIVSTIQKWTANIFQNASRMTHSLTHSCDSLKWCGCKQWLRQQKMC